MVARLLLPPALVLQLFSDCLPPSCHSMHYTHRLQGSDKELNDYSLAELAERHLGGMPPFADGSGASGTCDASPSGSADAGGTTATAWASAVAGSEGAGGRGGGAAVASGPSPLQRMRRALQVAVVLAEGLHERLSEAQLPVETIRLEMQVSIGGL